MLVYDVAVVLGSLPFIFILWWRPQQFGLNRFIALGIGLAICLDALLFPWMLYYGWVGRWLLLSVLFIVLVSARPALMRRWVSHSRAKVESLSMDEAIGEASPSRTRDLPLEAGILQAEVNPDGSFMAELAHNSGKELPGYIDEGIKQAQPVQFGESPEIRRDEDLSAEPFSEPDTVELLGGMMTMAEAETGQVYPEQATDDTAAPVSSDVPAWACFEVDLGLEELLDRGFAAKNEGAFPAAAQWFTNALALDPSPDIAFYLLTDIYWLSMTGGQPQFVSEPFRRIAAKYYRIFPPPLRQRFAEWLQREKLVQDGLFNIEGDIA